MRTIPSPLVTSWNSAVVRSLVAIVFLRSGSAAALVSVYRNVGSGVPIPIAFHRTCGSPHPPHPWPSPDTGIVVFLYDGDCAFCSSCARWLRRWVPTPVPVRPWQFTDIGSLGISAAECDAAVQWVDGPCRADGPGAIAALLRTSRVWWRVAGWLLGTRVGLALAWPVYRWVARNRDRMPGGTATCALPSAGAIHSSMRVG